MVFFPKEGVRLGDTGWPVALLQGLLAEKGFFFVHDMNGVFDEKTLRAVRRLQDEGLDMLQKDCSGALDQNTIEAWRIRGFDITRVPRPPFEMQFVSVVSTVISKTGDVDEAEAGTLLPDSIGDMRENAAND